MPVQIIQQRLEAETFSSLCQYNVTKECLTVVQILTSCGVVLDSSHSLNQCPVHDGDTLTVVLVDL